MGKLWTVNQRIAHRAEGQGEGVPRKKTMTMESQSLAERIVDTIPVP